jgi:hypothetical protein
VHVYLGVWDLALVAVASVQATVLAYLAEPRWKALLTTLPFPFTVAVLAVGRPVGASNVSGLVLLLLYFQEVRWLYHRWSMPIVLAIILSALTYCVLGTLLVPILPNGEVAFWVISALVWFTGVALLLIMPFRPEPEHRSPLPVYVKLPVVVGVVLFLVTVKGILQGFITVFPMVSIVAAYEARHSLWTLGRQLPVLFIAMVPMVAAIRLAQGSFGFGPALLIGWAVFLSLYVPLSWARSFRGRA